MLQLSPETRTLIGVVVVIAAVLAYYARFINFLLRNQQSTITDLRDRTDTLELQLTTIHAEHNKSLAEHERRCDEKIEERAKKHDAKVDSLIQAHEERIHQWEDRTEKIKGERDNAKDAYQNIALILEGATRELLSLRTYKDLAEEKMQKALREKEDQHAKELAEVHSEIGEMKGLLKSNAAKIDLRSQENT